MKQIVLSLLILLNSCSAQSIVKNRTELPAGFVHLSEIDSSIHEEIRYFTLHNFIGTPIRGYSAPTCILTLQAAQALRFVQTELKKQGLSLLVYDCYRPQRAVDHFVEWAKDLNDLKMKDEFYPKVDKSYLFKDGYIAEKSGHSRGSTLDLAIQSLDFGTPFDLFDPLSHTESSGISRLATKNRQLLKSIMTKNGFKNLAEEWWHYTLQHEPYPDTYFDFPVQ